MSSHFIKHNRSFAENAIDIATGREDTKVTQGLCVRVLLRISKIKGHGGNRRRPVVKFDVLKCLVHLRRTTPSSLRQVRLSVWSTACPATRWLVAAIAAAVDNI